MSSIPETHAAVVTTARKAPLAIQNVPTVSPGPGELLVYQHWTASTPFDLHQADGGMLATYPQVLGDGISGTVAALGAGVDDVKVGDWVFGFAWREPKEKAHQLYVTLPRYIVGRVPAGVKPEAAVTVPNGVVTAFHTMKTNLRLETPWPKPKGYEPERKDVPILVWGMASSSGIQLLQVLKWYGYKNVFGTASTANHKELKRLGAKEVFDYRDGDVAEKILAAGRKAQGQEGPAVPLMADCIGSMDSSMRPLANIAQPGSRVAVLLPVIVKDSDPKGETLPEYSFDVSGLAPWAEGVVVEGVRTHAYLQDEIFKEKLQSEIVPELLRQGAVEPTRQRIVEGNSLLERAQEAMNLLRSRAPRGERLVWRVADVE